MPTRDLLRRIVRGKAQFAHAAFSLSASSAVKRSTTKSTCSVHRGHSDDASVILRRDPRAHVRQSARTTTSAHTETDHARSPSGTVTFLFTDIEGSTALWERDRRAMQAAVDRHLALLREAI